MIEIRSAVADDFQPKSYNWEKANNMIEKYME